MPRKKKDFGKIDKLRELNRSRKVSFRAEPRAPGWEEELNPDTAWNETHPQPSPLLFRPTRPEMPNDEYNQQSQYARYLRSTNKTYFTPSEPFRSPDDRFEFTEYYFATGDSASLKWTVTREFKDLFIRFLTTLTIYTSATFQLILGEQFETNADPDDIFVWAQEQGLRTVLFSDDTAFPTFTLLPAPAGAGGSDAVRPIIIRAYPQGQPEKFDLLQILTTPTSIGSTIGLINAGDPALLPGSGFTPPTPTLAPRYHMGGYIWGGELQRFNVQFPTYRRSEITRMEVYALNEQTLEYELYDNIYNPTFDFPDYNPNVPGYVRRLREGGVGRQISEYAFESIRVGRTSVGASGNDDWIEPIYRTNENSVRPFKYEPWVNLRGGASYVFKTYWDYDGIEEAITSKPYYIVDAANDDTIKRAPISDIFKSRIGTINWRGSYTEVFFSIRTIPVGTNPGEIPPDAYNSKINTINWRGSYTEVFFSVRLLDTQVSVYNAGPGVINWVGSYTTVDLGGGVIG